MKHYELPEEFDSLVSVEFDEALSQIEHYLAHPEMMAWVGRNYSAQAVKVLVIGESHYLPSIRTYHRLPGQWYAGIPDDEKPDSCHYYTRRIIVNGIRFKWKERSKTIYRNIEKALFDSGLFREKPANAFTEIAFMNYFQRPAEREGDSVAVTTMDSCVAMKVHQAVREIISPDIVVFTSRLAWRHAKNQLAEASMVNAAKLINTPHPGSAWWGRRSKKYQNMTGRERFISQFSAALAETIGRG